jgi:predicted acylesterase/phospholipase RssA
MYRNMSFHISSEFDTIVMSGGSINGITILGALQYLKDKNLINNIKNYIGTSIGAVLSYLLIIGYTPVEVIVYLCTHYQLFERLKCFNIVNASRGEGAVSFSSISDELEKMTINKVGKVLNMGDLEDRFEKKFMCITYNTTKSKAEYLSGENTPDLPCLTAIRMTCNLPLVFEAYKYGDSFYIDGGLVNNFPLDIAEKMGSKVIGIFLSYDISEDNPNRNLLEFIYKLLYVPIADSTASKVLNKLDSSTIIELKTGNMNFFNFDVTSKMKLEMFSVGYEETKKFFEEQ